MASSPSPSHNDGGSTARTGERRPINYMGSGADTDSPSRAGGTSTDFDDGALEGIRSQYAELGVSPRLRNIPLRGGSPAVEAISLSGSPAAGESGFARREVGGAAGAGPGLTNAERLMSRSPRGGSPAPLLADSELPTPNPGDLDQLPISDEQKARIIERHLVLPESRDTASASGVAFPSGDPAASSGHSNAGSEYAFSDRPGGEASTSNERPDSSHESTSGIHSENAGEDEEYMAPHAMQGGAITDDVYRWAHNNKRKQARRTRSESLSMPRTSSLDPSLDVEGIKAPGGFRRQFVMNRAVEQGEPRPRVLRSFIDFLSLYGHFAGEELEEEDEDEYGEDDEEDEEAAMDHGAIPSSSRRPGTGDTESSALLGRGRSGLKRQDTAARIRRASQDKQRGEASVTEAVLMLLKSFVGTGILFLGKAFFNGGLLFSSIVLVAVAMISLFSFLLLVKTNLKVPAGFGDMGGILYGPWMRLAILASIVFSQLGFVAAYTVFVAQNLQAFVLAVTRCKTLVPIPYLILAQCAVFLPLSLVRKIAKLSSTALVADVFILFGICYLFYFEIGQVARQGIADVVLFNSKSFPLFIGTAVFTFEGIGLIIPITESMKEPEKFPAALSGVMVGVMILFASAGGLSYAAFGSKIQTVVITNLPQQDKFVQAMQFLYSLAILLSTPLQLFPALSILERGLFTKSGKYSPKVKFEKNALRWVVVLVCALIAWVGANDLDKFVSLIGSIACVPLCFIYPPLLHYKACATKRLTKAVDIALLVFGVLCTAFAGSQTIRMMVDSESPSESPICNPN